MTRFLAICVFVGIVAGGVAAAVSADSSPPTSSEEQAWLSGTQIEFATDQVAWGVARDNLDDNVIRPLRPYFRTRAQACIDQTTLDAMRACVVAFQADLARPGPAPSVAKDLHTATRQFGSTAAQILTRHTNDISERLALFP